MTPANCLVIALFICSGIRQVDGKKPCPPGCNKCSYNSHRQAVCDEDDGCKTGYSFMNGICFRCPLYCDKCTFDFDRASFVCIEHGCHDGYWLNSVTDVCEDVSCPAQCHKCDFDREKVLVVCSQNGCHNGYRLNPTWSLCERCPSQFTHNADLQKCYHVDATTIVTRTVAAQLCADLGSGLVSIQSETELGYMVELLPTGTAYWTSALRQPMDFHWATGDRVLLNYELSWALWNPGEPSSSAETAAELFFTGTQWLLNDVPSTEGNSLLCVMPAFVYT